MRSGTRATVVALAVVMVAGWAVAQGAQPQSQPPMPMQHKMQQGAGQYQAVLDSAEQLLGAKIQNNQGQTLGSLDDIVLEPGLNYVAYGVLARGGVLGAGQNLYAIPWDILQLSSDHRNLILNLPEQAFENVQGFNKDRWPDRANQRWRSMAMGEAPMGEAPMGQAYGAEQQPMPPSASSGQSWREDQYREQQQWRKQQEQPQAMNEPSQPGEVYGRPTPQGPAPSEGSAWGSQKGASARDSQKAFDLRRVSRLMGLNVETLAGQEKVGEIKDIVLDFDQGLVAYGIIGLQGGRHAPVPWSAIEIQPMNQLALVDANLQTLNQVAYEGDRLPDLADPQYAQNIYSQFNREPYWEVLGFVGGPQMQQQRMHEGTPPQSMRQQGVQQDPLAQYFDPQKITVITGTIEGIGSFDDPALGIHGERLRVKTDQGQTVSVFAGPGQFLEQQGLTLRKNDQLQVRGSFATISGRSVFIASDIRTPQSEVQLRDQQGKALWTTMGMQGTPQPTRPY